MRRLAAVHALSAAIAVLLVAIVGIGSSDYLLRFQNGTVRLIATLAAVTGLGWARGGWCARSRQARLGDAALARRVEWCFPALRDRLLSAVEFLGQPENDPAAGSVAMRRELIAEVTAEAGAVDFSTVLDRRPTLRAVARSRSWPYCSRASSP